VKAKSNILKTEHMRMRKVDEETYAETWMPYNRGYEMDPTMD